MNHIKVVLIVGMIFFLLIACVTPSEYHQGKLYSQRGQYHEAIQSFQVALDKAQTQQDRQMIKEAMARAKSGLARQYVEQAADIHDEATPVSLEQIYKAIDILQSGLQYDDSSQQISKKLTEYAVEAEEIDREIKGLLKDAAGLADRDRYEEALKKMATARQRDPENPQALRLIKDIKKRRDVYYVKQIDAFIEERDWKTSREFLKKLSAVAPQHPKIRSFREQIREMEKRDMIAKLKKMKDENRWYRAYLTITSSELADEMSDELQKIKSFGSRYYRDLAQNDLRKNSVFTAYISAVKGKELDSEDEKIFELHKLSEDAVNRAIQKYIAVSAFDSPSNDPDAGKQFSDDLISYLFRLLPFGVELMEREKIDLAMKEKKGDLRGAGEFLGIDILVIGNVSLLKVDKTDSELTSMTKVKIGEEKMENPEFNLMFRRYGNDMRQWPYMPDQFIKEDRYDIVKYKKGSVSLHGFINVSVRIFDVAQGAILYTNVFKKNLLRKDTYQDPVPEANIPEDPLELPTETKIKEELKESVIVEIAKVVLDTFQEREKGFLNKATHYLKRKENLRALEQLAKGHLYCKRAKIQPENEHLIKINEMILSLTE